ncbi:MAG TPA: MgtC/SapB family protein [Gemmatimonadaceae bacterium]|nr:MgtC/SapB family protein [Gemmatimonadaceae bacterium]
MPWNDLIVEVFRLDLAAKLFGAVLIGGGIGLEREYKGKPAGLRTNILICVGSALLMDLSMRVAQQHGGDPGRIAAQVVSGIGFLGAGTILHTRGMITGLTSAATIWVVAAIGLTIGAGYFIEALGATLTVMLVLIGLGWVERRYLDFEANGSVEETSTWTPRGRRDSEERPAVRGPERRQQAPASKDREKQPPAMKAHEKRQHRPVHPDDADPQ